MLFEGSCEKRRQFRAHRRCLKEVIETMRCKQLLQLVAAHFGLGSWQNEMHITSKCFKCPLKYFSLFALMSSFGRCVN